jgi:hypothetical protein
MNVFAMTAWSLSGQHTGTTDIPLDLTIMREMRQLIGSSVKPRLFFPAEIGSTRRSSFSPQETPRKTQSS